MSTKERVRAFLEKYYGEAAAQTAEAKCSGDCNHKEPAEKCGGDCSSKCSQ